MKALAITPGVADSLRLIDAPVPSLHEIPGGRGVLVQVLRTGICGTDRELFHGHFGQAPAGEDCLILGHESLGRIVATAPGVPASHAPGTLVVATVRRPGLTPYDRIGMQDMSPQSSHIERGIGSMHGFMAEFYADDATYLVPVPAQLINVGVLAEPLSVVEKGIRQAFEIQRRMKIWQPARAAVIGAGPIGLLAAMALRMRGMEVTTFSRRTAPYANSDLLAAAGIAYQSTGDGTLENVVVAPFDIIFEASGSSVRVFEAASLLANNGVLILSSITIGGQALTIDADAFNRAFVFGNKVMAGTVNSAYEDFQLAIDDMIRAEMLYPGWLGRMLTTPIVGLDRVEEVRAQLQDGRGAIKAYIEVAPLG